MLRATAQNLSHRLLPFWFDGTLYSFFLLHIIHPTILCSTSPVFSFYLPSSFVILGYKRGELPSLEVRRKWFAPTPEVDAYFVYVSRYWIDNSTFPLFLLPLLIIPHSPSPLFSLSMSQQRELQERL